MSFLGFYHMTKLSLLFNQTCLNERPLPNYIYIERERDGLDKMILGG